MATTMVNEGANEIHEQMKQLPAEWNSAITGSLTFAYYAVPDFVKSRFLRGILKTTFLTTILANIYHQEPEVYRDMHKEVLSELREDDPWAEDFDPTGIEDTSERNKRLAIVGAGAVGLVGVAVAGEKFLYHRAEKKRAKGVKYAHSKQACGMSVLAIIITYVIEKFLQKK